MGGLACLASPLRPRSWASVAEPSEDRSDEREEHTLGRMLLIVTFYWQRLSAEEALFWYPWLSAAWAVSHMYSALVCFSDAIFQGFSLRVIYIFGNSAFFFLFFFF